MGRPLRTSATPALPTFIDQLPAGDEKLLSSSPTCHRTTRSATSALGGGRAAIAAVSTRGGGESGEGSRAQGAIRRPGGA